jgi:hypothetical protein
VQLSSVELSALNFSDVLLSAAIALGAALALLALVSFTGSKRAYSGSGPFIWHSLLLGAAAVLVVLLLVRTSQPPEVSKDSVNAAAYTIDAVTFTMLAALVVLGVLSLPVLSWLRTNVGTIKAGAFELGFIAATPDSQLQEVIDEKEADAPASPAEAAKRLQDKLERIRRFIPETKSLDDPRLIARLEGEGALPADQAALARALLTLPLASWPPGQPYWAHRAQKLIREIVQRAWEQRVTEEFGKNAFRRRFVEDTRAASRHWPDFVVSHRDGRWIRVAARTATKPESDLLKATLNRFTKARAPQAWRKWVVLPDKSKSPTNTIDGVEVIKLSQLKSRLPVPLEDG